MITAVIDLTTAELMNTLLGSAHGMPAALEGEAHGGRVGPSAGRPPGGSTRRRSALERCRAYFRTTRQRAPWAGGTPLPTPQPERHHPPPHEGEVEEVPG
jgi:hypothetical protein